MNRPSNRERTAERLGPYSLFEAGAGLRLTQDPVLLAGFLPPLSEDDTVADLGTGTGAIPLILAWKTKARNIVGVELDERASALARRNIEANGLSERISIIEKDLRTLKEVFPEGSFSVVVSNPPYTKAGAGRVSPVKERAMARSEVLLSLPELIDVSAHLAGMEGRIFYIYPVARLFEMLKEAGKAGLSPRRLQFVHTNPKKAAKLFMIELGRIGELSIEEPITLPISGC